MVMRPLGELLRFEDRRSGANRFCIIQRAKSDLHITFGRHGHPGTIRIETYDVPEEAQRRQNKRVRSLIARGYVQGAFNPELFELVCKNSEGKEAFRLYARWLGERDDPRGDFIDAGLALCEDPDDEAASATFARLLRKHPETLDVASLSQSEQQRWRAGFVRSATFLAVKSKLADPYESVGRLRRFLQHPSCGLLRRLRLEHSHAAVEDVIGRYAPSSLEEVTIVPTDRLPAWFGRHPLRGRFRVQHIGDKIELIAEEPEEEPPDIDGGSPYRSSGRAPRGTPGRAGRSPQTRDPKREPSPPPKPLGALKNFLAWLENLLLG